MNIIFRAWWIETLHCVELFKPKSIYHNNMWWALYHSTTTSLLPRVTSSRRKSVCTWLRRKLLRCNLLLNKRERSYELPILSASEKMAYSELSSSNRSLSRSTNILRRKERCGGQKLSADLSAVALCEGGSESWRTVIFEYFYNTHILNKRFIKAVKKAIRYMGILIDMIPRTQKWLDNQKLSNDFCVRPEPV